MVSGANIITKEVKVNGKTNLIIPVQLRVDEIKSVTVSTGCGQQPNKEKYRQHLKGYFKRY